MSRKSKINWRKGDAEKLTKEIERFNAKIYRTRKAHPESIDILPDLIRADDKAKMVEELQNKTRSEFNKTLKSMDRFLKRGTEKEIVSATGNRVTRWEKNEVAIKVAQINRERTKERKAIENMDATSQGQNLGLKRGEMGSERLNELKPKKFDFNKIKGGKEWEKFKAAIDKLSSPEAKDQRKEDYKTNYLKAMENAYGEHGKEIIEMIKGLPADVVVKTYYKEQEATIDFHYELQEMQLKLDILYNIWQGVKEDYEEVHG